MTIRAATVDDIEAIQHVARRSWETDYPTVMSRETVTTGVDDWYSATELADELITSRTRILVAERDGDVVGFAHLVWGNDEGTILRLYVDPDHRRAGVGHSLLEHACDALFVEGVRRVNAMVLSGNELGNAFYEGFGFEAVAEAETTVGGETYPETTYALSRD